MFHYSYINFSEFAGSFTSPSVSSKAVLSLTYKSLGDPSQNLHQSEVLIINTLKKIR